MKCEEIETLVSGYVDGELTQQQAQRVRLHIENCERCRRVHRDILQLRDQMQQLTYPRGDERVLEELEKDLLAGTTRGFGWGLLIVGLLGVVGFALFQFFSASELPVLLRIFYAVLMLGGLFLFVSVLRQRLMTHKNDKYRKVKL